VGADAFQSLAGWLDYPMFIVTTAVGDERAGCLVGFWTQTSIHPPRFLTCISVRNYTHGVALHADALAVHVVPDDGYEIARLFGGVSEDDTDKFARSDWRPGPGGLPLLADCPVWFAGRIVNHVSLGDHTGFLLEPFEGADPGPQTWLPFSRTKSIQPGHPA
jgi:flavin reductase (DIM6/NTAB) family NADH-FMN oxidoreductase RutF